jgi:hypothetical protein
MFFAHLYGATRREHSRADMMNAVDAAGFTLIFYSGWRKSEFFQRKRFLPSNFVTVLSYLMVYNVNYLKR